MDAQTGGDAESPRGAAVLRPYTWRRRPRGNAAE